MKITFFKNERDFFLYDRILWENAQRIKFQPIFSYVAKILSILEVSLLMQTACYYEQPFWIIITLILLPVHELCHGLYCWVTGKSVERICFLPSRNIFQSLAYVQPTFMLWSKKQRMLFNLFPLLLLTMFPALLSIILPSCRGWLLYTSLLNLAVSHRDIESLLWMAKLPDNIISTGSVTLLPDENTVDIHRLFITNSNRFYHHHYRWENGIVTEIDPPQETDEIIQLKTEMKL